MTKLAILATVDAARHKVDAFETLGASLAEGIRAGVVDADHVYTLIRTMAQAIRTDVQELASAIDQMQT